MITEKQVQEFLKDLRTITDLSDPQAYKVAKKWYKFITQEDWAEWKEQNKDSELSQALAKEKERLMKGR